MQFYFEELSLLFVDIWVDVERYRIFFLNLNYTWMQGMKKYFRPTFFRIVRNKIDSANKIRNPN